MSAIEPMPRLGRYEIVKELGRGAMGVVYEGRDPRLERQVAMKTVLKSHLLDQTLADEYSARFVREAQAAARLNHPNIVTVFDFGEQDDVAYLVMEFIRGRELSGALAAGERFSQAETVRVMGELLDALDYAHAQGVVHRDVKPANVMIDTTGRVKLTDFGVARITQAGQDRTAPGTMVGTPSYMSPEQIQGLPVGPRTDLFAAGIILYQLLTGRRPFGGSGHFAIQKQIVQDDPLPPSQVDPALPPAFDTIVRRALAKLPQDRYETAGRFAAELRALLVAPPAPAPKQAEPRRAVAPPDPDATVLRRTLLAPAATAPTAAGGPRTRRWLLGGVAVAGAGGLLAWLAGAPRQSIRPAEAPIGAPPKGSAVQTLPAPGSAPTAAAAAPATESIAVQDLAPASAPTPKLQEPRRAAQISPAARTVAPSERRADPRCADLRERMQLGEPLPPEQQSVFDKECKR